MDLHEKVAELSKLPSNSRCIDCNDPNPNWVSLNFGCFICLNCAGFHRSLGTHITSVKSVELDSFQPQMVQMLEIGGNENFRSYLLTLSLPIAGPSKKYGVPEVLYYSEILKAKIESREPNPYEEAYWQGLIPCTDTTSTKTVAPWVPDSSNSHCMICSKQFSLLFRKHHCRRCGKLICGECGPANNARPILEWGIKDPVRHCKNCYKSPAIDWK